MKIPEDFSSGIWLMMKILLQHIIEHHECKSIAENDLIA